MTLSLAVSASAVKADEKINEDYAEAVAVLNGMGVFKGYEDGSFKPENNITRAEVATIIYRIYTADVAKNDKSGLYASYNKFTDMAGAGWAAGYIAVSYTHLQREERIELLEQRIRDLGMNPEDYWWYCDLRRYGSCRHAGFGLGFERMVMYLTGIGNIRDVELHPRTVGNADF